MALPSDLTTVQVTGTYLDPSGAPLAGHITFTPSVQLTDSTGSTVIPAYPKQYNLSAAGMFTTDPLVATDNVDILPSSWTYLVTLALQNLPTTSWNAALPAAPFSFTATSATPCVFTAAGSAYANGNPVKLAGGSLPSGFTAGTTYFVVSASGASFSLAATSGGSAIASTSTGSGTVSTASSDISALAPVFTQLAALQYAELLLPTSVQSGSITAAAGQLVLVTTASGNATVSLPTGVEAGSQVGVKMVVLGGSNTVTISCTGTDKLNVAGGPTSMTLSMLDQGASLIYTSSLWVVENDDVPLGQLDARYNSRYVTQAVTRAFIASGDTATYWNFQQTGGSDAFPGFELAVQDHNYGAPPVNETSFYIGMNAAGVDGGSLPYAFWTIHPWAGDTNCLEWNFSAGTQIPGVQNVNWLQYFVSQIDGHGSLTIRHPDTANSTVSFQSGPTLGIFYLTMQPTGNAPIDFGAGVGIRETRSGVANTAVVVSAPDLTGSNTISSTFSVGTTGSLNSVFKWNTTTFWTEQFGASGTYWAMQNNGGGGGYSGNQLVLWPGASADAAMVQVFTRLQTNGSLVVGTAAIATNATSGFLYIPSCAGAPTGTPTARTGTIPMAYDSTDSRLYLFEGAAWHYIAMTA